MYSSLVFYVQVAFRLLVTGVARRCSGCTCRHLQGGKKFGAKFTGKSCKCIPRS